MFGPGLPWMQWMQAWKPQTLPRTSPAFLTLGWLGAWQLKADGTHAQALAAALPPGGGGGGGDVGGLVPRRRPLGR